jgi:hypothetical protein
VVRLRKEQKRYGSPPISQEHDVEMELVAAALLVLVLVLSLDMDMEMMAQTACLSIRPLCSPVCCQLAIIIIVLPSVCTAVVDDGGTLACHVPRNSYR